VFVILDTNHYQELVYDTVPGRLLRSRIDAADADSFTTAITAQEIVQGWVARINRSPAGREQVNPYSLFVGALRSLEKITILPFDAEAAEVFHSFTGPLKRIGTMDLKIASIAISHEALLLSRNLQHFAQVPGLKVENWLD
jgi:tRNA(fMet)-specific endonuclease VapC